MPTSKRGCCQYQWRQEDKLGLEKEITTNRTLNSSCSICWRSLTIYLSCTCISHAVGEYSRSSLLI
uniref:Uncharacterized protein n=1 Tax=Hyaloperonospora arabidopsidis (strain Emoy2) TaxID=559515 RepID=M4BVC3_HYAAE